jgi:hypothetical protein
MQYVSVGYVYMNEVEKGHHYTVIVALRDLSPNLGAKNPSNEYIKPVLCDPNSGGSVKKIRDPQRDVKGSAWTHGGLLPGLGRH